MMFDAQDIRDRFNPDAPELDELARHPVVGYLLPDTDEPVSYEPPPVSYCHACGWVTSSWEPCECNDIPAPDLDTDDGRMLPPPRFLDWWDE